MTIDECKLYVAEMNGYNTWDDLWYNLFDSKEIHTIIEELVHKYNEENQKL